MQCAQEDYEMLRRGHEAFQSLVASAVDWLVGHVGIKHIARADLERGCQLLLLNSVLMTVEGNEVRMRLPACLPAEARADQRTSGP